MKIKLWIACALGLSLPVWAGESVGAEALPVIPAPMTCSVDSGYFYFTPSTTIGVECESQLQMVSTFVDRLGRTAGFLPAIEVGAPEPDVRLTTVPSMAPEAYRLEVSAGRMTIKASGDAGFFYALQTLRQLLPPAIEGVEPVARNLCRVPAMTIDDAPRFGYRGLMIDVSRYFMPKKICCRLSRRPRC